MATSSSWRSAQDSCCLFVLVVCIWKCIVRTFCGCKVKDNDVENESSTRGYNSDIDLEKGMTEFEFPLQNCEAIQDFQEMQSTVVYETDVRSLVESIVSVKEPSENDKELRREVRRKINIRIKKLKHKPKKRAKTKPRPAFCRKGFLEKCAACTTNYEWQTPTPCCTLGNLLVERSLAPPIRTSTMPRTHNVSSHMRQNPPFSWTPARRTTLGELLMSRSLAPPIGMSTMPRRQSSRWSTIMSNIREDPCFPCTPTRCCTQESAHGKDSFAIFY